MWVDEARPSTSHSFSHPPPPPPEPLCIPLLLVSSATTHPPMPHAVHPTAGLPPCPPSCSCASSRRRRRRGGASRCSGSWERSGRAMRGPSCSSPQRLRLRLRSWVAGSAWPASWWLWRGRGQRRPRHGALWAKSRLWLALVLSLAADVSVKRPFFFGCGGWRRPSNSTIEYRQLSAHGALGRLIPCPV